jgi:hypothetical protein
MMAKMRRKESSRERRDDERGPNGIKWDKCTYTCGLILRRLV